MLLGSMRPLNKQFSHRDIKSPEARVTVTFEPSLTRWVPLVTIRLPGKTRLAQQVTRSGSRDLNVGSKISPAITKPPG